MPSKKYLAARSEDLVIQELGNEVLIYDLKTNKAFCLNETSAVVWQLANGTRSVVEINQEAGKKLKPPIGDDLIWLALSELEKNNLLADGGGLQSKLKGLSRREAIRKVGLTTMVALPVITSLVAPTAAAAQSQTNCVPLGQTCQINTPPCCAPYECVAGICDDGGV